jgi:hypothetical protein
MSLTTGIGFGTTLGYHTGTGSGAFTVIAEVVDQIDNDVTGTEVDTTLLGDTFKTNRRSDVDPGELQFEIALDNGNTMNQVLATLLENGSVATWQLTYSNGGTADSFTGWVKSLGRAVAKNKMLTRKVTVRLTGNPGVYTGS